MSKRKAYRTDLSDTAGSAKKGTPVRLPGPEEDGPPALVDKDLYRRIVRASPDEAPLSELFGLETPHSNRAETALGWVSDADSGCGPAWRDARPADICRPPTSRRIDTTLPSAVVSRRTLRFRPGEWTSSNIPTRWAEASPEGTVSRRRP